MKYDELEYSTQVIGKVVLAFVLVAFFWFVRDIVILLLLALILASAMEPVVNFMQQRKVPRMVSVITVYILVLGLTALIIYLLIPPVISQFKILQDNLPAYSQVLQTRYSWLLGGSSANDWFQQLIASFTGDGHSVITSTFGAFNGVLEFVAVLVIAFYLVAEERSINSLVAAVIPSHNHDMILGLIHKIQNKMGMWVIGQLIISFGIFIFTFIGLLVLKVQYALVLALIAGLLEIVPYIGPFLSAVPALFIAFIQHPPLAIAVAVLYLLVHEVEGYVLVPKIMEKTVGTSPLVTMIALLVGFKLAGVVGLFISVPLAAALTVAIKEFWPGKAV